MSKPKFSLSKIFENYLTLTSCIIMGVIELNHFYSVGFTDYKIQFQGDFTPEILAFYTEKGFVLTLDEPNNWYNGELGENKNVEITLTNVSDYKPKTEN